MAIILITLIVCYILLSWFAAYSSHYVFPLVIRFTRFRGLLKMASTASCSEIELTEYMGMKVDSCVLISFSRLCMSF